MAYLGIYPTISVTETNPGDLLWKEVTVTVPDTEIDIQFATEGPKQLYLKLTMVGDQSGLSFGSSITWIGGSFPGYTPDASEIWKFFTPDGVTIYGTKIGMEGESITVVPNDSVTTNAIVDSAVTTNKIANSAVTSAKLATNSVTTTKLIDGVVTNNKILLGAVSFEKIDTDDVSTLSNIVSSSPQKLITSDVLREYITNWLPYTPTITTLSGAISNNSTTAYYRRVGDTLQVRGSIHFSGASSTFTGVIVSIPDTLEIDTTKLLSVSMFPVGATSIVDSGVVYYSGHCVYDSTTPDMVNLYVDRASATFVYYNSISNTNPHTFGTGDRINFEFSVPIVDW